MNKMYQKGATVILIVVLIALAVGGYFIYINYSKDRIKIPTQTSFDIVVKENTADKNKSDVYLKDKKSGQEKLFTTIKDVYRGHYHNAEFKNGNLYIIQRTGGDLGYEDNPDWTDELWKYDSNKKGTKLYSIRGLDFRVSNNDKLIAITGSDEEQKPLLIFTDTGGNELESFDRDTLGADIFTLLIWGKDSFWLGEKALPVPVAFIKIDISPFQASKYAVKDVSLGIEYVLNPDTKKIIYSDYPITFDVDSAKKFEQSGKIVTLSVYDLVSDEKKVIATSKTKKFNPKWVDDVTVEYDNPTGEGRITKKI